MEQFLPLAAQIMMTILQREKYCIVQSREDDFGLREVDPQCRMEFCPQVKTHKHKGELQAVLQKWDIIVVYGDVLGHKYRKLQKPVLFILLIEGVARMFALETILQDV